MTLEVSVTRPVRMTEQELSAALAELPLWVVEGGKLRRELRFADFVTAFGFMTSVALVAESMDHHPDWENVYNRVLIQLNTHDAGGITVLDTQLAARIDAIAAPLLGGLGDLD